MAGSARYRIPLSGQQLTPEQLAENEVWIRERMARLAQQFADELIAEERAMVLAKLRADRAAERTPSRRSAPTAPANPPSETLLALPEVRRRTAKSTSVIYSDMAAGTFPRPLKRGRQSVWVASEVQAVIDREIATLPRMYGLVDSPTKKPAR